MPSLYRPRRPRASPLWQIVHHAWADFAAHYHHSHRHTHGPLRPEAAAAVRAFYRCGDLSAGFTRLQCPHCGHERLLAFTCKGRYFCPACHQRRVRQGGDWIARTLCHAVPHRQFVFTMPRPLRGIFRQRRDLLGILFRVAIGCLRDWFRARLGLPEGQLAAVAAVQTFGDYLIFHPHLHVLAATGLFDADNRFHLLPVESIQPLAELFRQRFLATLLEEKLISERKRRELLGWKHSGFNLDAGDKPIPAHHLEALRSMAEYLLRAPFSLEKITWNPATSRVIYRSSRHWRTKRNFEVFTAGDFLAAAIAHIPPKHQQTVRYYGLYSNKHRGQGKSHPIVPPKDAPAAPPPPASIVPPPPARSARALRPLWRELILRVFGEDPLRCPCCRGTMQPAGAILRAEEIEFFLRLHGLWEGAIDIPPPPEPPYDIETMEPIRVPPSRWPPETEADADAAEHAWRAPELPLDDGRILVFDAEPAPAAD